MQYTEQNFWKVLLETDKDYESGTVSTGGISGPLK